MTLQRPARRRFIHISAAFGGTVLAGALGPSGMARAALRSTSTDTAALTTHTWSGIALGADASLQISHPDADIAQTLIERCVAEVHRLEGLFSLYRDDSALVTLNRQGFLDNPASDFLALLNRSKEFSRLTDGMFDVTVQPLWQAYADHFSVMQHESGISQTRPPSHDTKHAEPAMDRALEQALQDALKRVNWRNIDIDTQRIRLLQPRMAITLNGIAQGYITDRITQVLAANGIEHALVNMGEIYGMNPESPATGQPWRVGLEDSRHPGNIATRIPLRNRAVATSGAYGTPFTPDMRHNHLLNPRHGTSSHRYHSVSVVAADATTADALSTAFSLMPEDAIKTLSRELDVQTYLQPANEAGIRQI